MHLIALILIGGLADAQDVTTDASVARATLRLAQHGIPGPDEIRVYDFINFFRHDLPAPGADGPVGFDARLLRGTLPEGEAGALLQLGFRTARVKREDLKPMNIVVVIDRSGSMADARKMDYVKQALNLFIAQLREDDRLALIAYDTEAEVLLPSAAVSDPNTVQALVAGIKPGGGTNLHAGLMLGYEEARKHCDPKRTNKVLLLSDGMANKGVTDPERIISDSKTHNAAGIDLTTIGIGLAYNDALMSQLAKAGRGDYHFLNSAEEIQRIFEQELQGLFEKVARSVTVRVRPGPGVSIRAVYGYAFKIEAGAAVFTLDDMGHALTQVLPIELAVSAEATLAPLAVATIRFIDGDGAAVEVQRTIKADRGPASVADESVMKHLAIARLALALKEACRLAADTKPTMGADLLTAATARIETIYGPAAKVDDKDLKRVLDLVVRARDVLKATQVE